VTITIEENQTKLYKKVLYTEEQVDQRITEMAKFFVDTFKDKKPLFVGLMNGAQPFAASLMAAIQLCDPYFQPDLQPMAASRYGSKRKPGVMKLIADLPPDYRDLTGRHVIILDDLIDNGGTIEFAKKHLYDYGAEKVECCVLIQKLKGSPCSVTPLLCGFEAPDVWLTGMGMDDDRIAPEANRWLRCIAIAND
jgi:hypoxanthine phosphoribosyltransferase